MKSEFPRTKTKPLRLRVKLLFTKTDLARLRRRPL